MDLYILDEFYQRQYVVDDFESLIWTERYAAAGEFEMTIAPDVMHDISIGKVLRLDRSTRFMIVEVIENRINDSGERINKVKGSSLESTLKGRVAQASLKPTQDANGTDVGGWKLTGTPGRVIRDIYKYTCTNYAENPLDNFTTFSYDQEEHVGNLIPEPTNTVTVELELTTVYDAITELCTTYDFGFSIALDPMNNNQVFRVYTGRDLTTTQTKNPAVLFTPELDNLTNVSEVDSAVDTYNVAYIYSPVMSLQVFPEGVPEDLTDVERRVLLVKAENVDKTTVNPKDILIQQARAALAQRRQIKVFDGEVRQDSQYEYGRDYQLGDVVEVRNDDGESNRMRVSEQIFACDKNGVRSYPTLEQYQYVNKGSWISWTSNKQWIDYDKDPTTWSEQP